MAAFRSALPASEAASPGAGCEVARRCAHLRELTPDPLVGPASAIADTVRKRRRDVGFGDVAVHGVETDASAPVVAERART